VNTHLTGADLTDTTLAGADLTGVDLGGLLSQIMKYVERIHQKREKTQPRLQPQIQQAPMYHSLISLK
jgi:hypothetical protein